MDKYDIVIVGAGPAGISAALHSTGNVLLIEKNKKIGVPVKCGEGLFGKIVDYFDVRDCVRDAHVVHDVEFCFPNGTSKRMTIRSNDIFVLNKDTFLQSMVTKAREKNPDLTVKTDTKAWYDIDNILFMDGEAIEAKVIIDATGMQSEIGRAKGLSSSLSAKDIHVCAQYTVESTKVDPSAVRLFIDEPYSPTGYTWVFPKNDNRANIGMGVRGMDHFDVKKYLDWFISDHYGDAEKSNFFIAPIALTPPVQRCVEDNVLLTGDAARFCISMSGAGIGNAMLSGKYAGTIASYYNNGQATLNYYQFVMEAVLYRKLKKAYKYKEYFLRERNMRKLQRVASFLFSAHSLFPRTVERFALKNFRF